jgi:hypothetical protein
VLWFNILTAVNSLHGQKQLWPRNTADASYSGVIMAMIGAIVMQADQLESRCQDVPTIVMTGGMPASIVANSNVNFWSKAGVCGKFGFGRLVFDGKRIRMKRYLILLVLLNVGIFCYFKWLASPISEYS